MQNYILLGLLVPCAAEDIRKKEVNVIYILLLGIVGVIVHLIAPNCSMSSILLGILPGIAMMAVSFFSKGGIGMGDGILLVVTGVYLGGINNLCLLLTALLMSAVWALGMLVLKRKTRKERVAFVPFLLAAYAVMLVW